MRFYMVYSNQYETGNKPIGIASLSAILKRAGHDFRLFDCTEYSIKIMAKEQSWNLKGVRPLRLKFPSNPERLPERIPVTYNELIEKVVKDIDDFKPDMIGLSALTDDYPLGLGIMHRVKRTFPKVPTVAGGIHPSVDPLNVLLEDCFDMVCVGEGEYVVLDMAERIENKQNFSGIANLWIKKEDRTVERNTVRPFENNLDLFPFPDWSIYRETTFYKPYLGYVYKYGDFEMSRGCPFKCSYCINVQLQEIYKTASPQYHREKSIDRVINEIQYAIDNYQIEFLKFWDETFLLMSTERMQEFCDKYSSAIGLPYLIETTGPSITEFSAKILKKTNCMSASLGMETGSPNFHTGLLNKPTTNEAYVKAYQLLEENGVKGASFNMIGLPNESLENIFMTIGLNKLVNTFTQTAGIFYPYKGTPIRDMMVQKGWIGEDFDLKAIQDYDLNAFRTPNRSQDYDLKSFTSGNRSVVKFRGMDSRLVNRMSLLFSTYTYWPTYFFPLIDYVKNNDDDFASTLLNNLQTVTYFKKYGELPPEAEEEIYPTAEEIRSAQAEVSNIGDPSIKEFATLLVNYWNGLALNQLTTILQKIICGELQPEFPIPESPYELADWLDLDLEGDEILRKIRKELRNLAKENSVFYDPCRLEKIDKLKV